MLVGVKTPPVELVATAPEIAVVPCLSRNVPASRVVCAIGSLNVTEIHTKLKLPQNLTSHHLSKLKSVGLLNEKHSGTFRNYSVNMRNFKEHSRIFKELFGI